MAQRFELGTWAIYGFATAYQFTQDARFLDTAQRCADFYIERTPAHGVPPNDWEEPNPAQPYESSAAAIAAAGLLELSQIVTEPSKSDYYREYAFLILNTLLSPEFLANETPGWEGILRHGIYHERKSLVSMRALCGVNTFSCQLWIKLCAWRPEQMVN